MMSAPPIVTSFYLFYLLAFPVCCQYHKVPSMQERKGEFLGDLSIAMQCNKVCHACIETQCPMPWGGPCNVRYANAAGCPTSPAARGSPMSPPEQQEMLGLHTAHTVHWQVSQSLPHNTVQQGVTTCGLSSLASFPKILSSKHVCCVFRDIRDKYAVNQGFWSKTAVFSLSATKVHYLLIFCLPHLYNLLQPEDLRTEDWVKLSSVLNPQSSILDLQSAF